jgi:protoporphyrinogen oxidase
MKNVYDYLILGSGVTGIACGRVLQQRNNDNFLILEAESDIGGLCRTREIDGHYFDIGGGHVLHSKYDDVLEWIFNHIPEDKFYKMDTKVVIQLEGNEVNFPIELNLWQLPKDLQVEYLHSYITAASQDIEYENYEDWVRNYLGDKIADNYMIPYNKKLWCIDISKLNTAWLSKIPETDLKLILKTIVEKKANFDESVVSHSSFYYPKEGGFQTIIDSIAKHVKDKILLNTRVDTIRYDSDSDLWFINEEFVAKKVITTIPWPVLDIQGLPEFDFKSEMDNLEVLSNVISLWERDAYTHDNHWMYIPDPEVEQHREFYIKNIAPHSKEGGVMTDINYKRWLENGKKWKAGIPLAEHVNVWSYPLPTTIYKESIRKILDFTKDYNLYGLGRWGQWQYFNTDQCIKQAIDFFKNEKDFDYFKIF